MKAIIGMDQKRENLQQQIERIEQFKKEAAKGDKSLS